MSNLKEEYCIECGVHFGFPENMFSTWKRDSKVFYCPNGHGQKYNPDTKETKEVDRLRAEVVSLNALVASQKKKIEELTLELEIWKPETKEANNG